MGSIYQTIYVYSSVVHMKNRSEREEYNKMQIKIGIRMFLMSIKVPKNSEEIPKLSKFLLQFEMGTTFFPFFPVLYCTILKLICIPLNSPTERLTYMI